MNYPAAIKRYLVLPTALMLATYSSIISLELLADVYTPTEDYGAASSDRLHRENLTTRTVKNFDKPEEPEQWSAFAQVSGSKLKIKENLSTEQPEQKSRQQTLTLGIDRTFGPQLLGIALGTSNGDANITRSDGGTSEIDRDKQSLGMYYGAVLPYLLNFTTQVLFSDYQYDAKLSDLGTQTDHAEYDANGYSAAVGLSSLIPLISGDFEFLVQPSISYLYVKTETDAYQSQSNVSFGKSTLISGEWEFAVKWRAFKSLGNAYLIPMGGFSYNMLDWEFRGDEQSQKRAQNFFQGIVGLSVQRFNLSLSASYQRTIAENRYKREQYQVTFRLTF